MTDRVTQSLLDDKARILERLMELVRQPSVSADPAFAEGMAGARALLMRRLHEAGLQAVQELEAPGGHAAVYAEWLGAPGRPTLLIYGHYDVQPPDPLAAWHSPPFAPEIRDGRLYGRGASDTKATVTIAIEAIAACLAAGVCPVNVKLFLEGEEEVGSPSLRPLIAANRERLQADAVLSADGSRASVRLPTISTGTRGMAKMEMRLSTARKDLHSGRYGGAARNALHEMARLVASLHDDEGRILVPGFLDDVRPLSERDRADAAELAADDADFYEGFGGSPYGDPDFTLRERLTLRPTIEVNGLWGGYQGAGSKTVIPCEAQAKITMRLAPGQDPARAAGAVKAHLLARCPAGVSLDFQALQGQSAASTLEDEHPLLVAAEKVMGEIFGRRPVRARGGGTLPITSVFKETLGIDTLRFAFGMPDEDVHAPNEFFRLSSLEEGLRAWSMMLAELGRLKSEDFAPFRRAVG
ncbi:dipeptidase [Roseomonas sp. E05]|uniref:dipeptidase n=1 Tax=Roseomonas sp. E05 TaxID=3046310 RepID=UPI0024BBC91D|nr:dipeptidase [Roseomonas sp. E05]MDJ0388933.1 dipeptidase [Roseomonas sp. E05]